MRQRRSHPTLSCPARPFALLFIRSLFALYSLFIRCRLATRVSVSALTGRTFRDEALHHFPLVYSIVPVGHRNYTRPWLALLALIALPARRTVQVGSGAADVHALYHAEPEPPLHRHATASAFDRHFRASTHFLIGTFSLSNCRTFYGFLALCEARFSCKSQFNTVHRVSDPSKMLRITTSLAPAFLALSSCGHAVFHFPPLY